MDGLDHCSLDLIYYWFSKKDVRTFYHNFELKGDIQEMLLVILAGWSKISVN